MYKKLKQEGHDGPKSHGPKSRSPELSGLCGIAF